MQSTRARWYVALLVAGVLVVGCSGDDGGGGGGLAAPSTVIGLDGPTGVELVWELVPGATGYNVYESADGAVYSKVTPTPTPSNVYMSTNSTQDLWYYVTAVSGGTESPPSDAVWATITTVANDMVLSPGDAETDVSTTPTVSWQAVSGTKSYFVVVMDASIVSAVWALNVAAPATSVLFGSSSGTLHFPATENPLYADTQYQLMAIAVNTFNFGSHGGGFNSFTTAP